MTWDDLDFWRSGEWQVCQERIDDLDRMGRVYTPKREHLFAALDATPFDKVRVVLVGQDPYPNASLSTGIAFSIPRNEKVFPPTLINIFKEYYEDLHYPFPTNGDLGKWTKEGVLLWNSVPLWEKGNPYSIAEWMYLTKEIIQKLTPKGIVFVFLGAAAQQYTTYVTNSSEYICCSHPSPRGHDKGEHPFTGSRIFSTINGKLVDSGLSPIDWRL